MGFRARRSLSEVRRVEVDIKERTNKRGGKGPTIQCNSDTGHKVMTSPTGQKPCRRRPLCVQSLVYKFIAHYHFILPRQRYSLRVGSLLQSLSLLLLPSPHTALDSNDRRSSISGFTKVPRKGESGGVGEAFALAIDRDRSIVQRGVERSKRRIFRVRRRRERSLNVRGNGRGYVRERHFES